MKCTKLDPNFFCCCLSFSVGIFGFLNDFSASPFNRFLFFSIVTSPIFNFLFCSINKEPYGLVFFICLMRAFSRHKLMFIITNDLIILFQTHWWYQIAELKLLNFYWNWIIFFISVECVYKLTFFFLCSSFSDSESDAITWNNHQLINAII